LFGAPNDGTFYIGFSATAPFDEIKLSVESLATANAIFDDYIDVFGAFVDTRASSAGLTLTCNKTNPDVNVALKNETVFGDVSTNDVVDNLTTYGTPIADPNNPS